MDAWAHRLLAAEATLLRFPGFDELLQTKDYAVAFSRPDGKRALVVRFDLQDHERSAATRAPQLVDEIVELAHARGVKRLIWMLRPLSVPAQEEMHGILSNTGLAKSGAGWILGWDLGAGPRAQLPGKSPDLNVRRVDDRQTLMDAVNVHRTVMGKLAASDEELAAALEALKRPPQQPHDERFVAYLGNVPISQGCYHIRNGVALLWGGSTLPDYRRLGGYTAVLRERCREAHARGADAAVTAAKPKTSGPILMRYGFRHLANTYTYARDL